ncbi:MAG: hypothetical protein IJR82_02265 [Bacilli bacterium]|nr:hypothetical protein [Bacilli bacterium]
MKFFSILFNNIYLCWGIILVLLISNIILIIKCSNLKKRKQIKEELVQIEKEVNTPVVEKPENSELDNILNQMQKDMEVKPEQVVANFEAEQEKNSIISYRELVNCVKNNKLQVVEDDVSEVDFVKQLEQDIKQEPIVNANSLSNKSHLDIIDDLNETKKFTSSEIISPVYGRMSNPKYPKMENYNNQNSLKLGENTMDLEPVTNEIKKNEDFLKNLVDFRKNL